MKVLVVGPVASGKSTISKKLQEELEIPLYELDHIVHNDETGTKRTEEEQRKMINDIIRKDKEWIIEGVPRSHLDVLSSNATMILYLDFPKKLLKKRLFLRHLKIKLGITKVKYKANKELYQRMLNYIKNDKREVLMECMKRYPTKLIIVKSDKEIKTLITAIKEGEILKYQ